LLCTSWINSPSTATVQTTTLTSQARGCIMEGELSKGGVVEQGRRDLDWLDEAFRDTQDELSEAIEVGTTEQTSIARAAAGNVHIVDAEGLEWRVHAPQGDRGAKPYYRFHYRYWGAHPGGELRPVARSRFAARPSLAKTYAASLSTKGWLPATIRNVEPIGYVAAAAVGIGLWFLLGDIVGSLPGTVIVAAMVILAAGLWFSTARLNTVLFREAERLAHVTRAAAIGVTGAVPWLVMMDATWITDAGRTAITASVVTLASALSYARTRSSLTFSIGLGSMIVALGSTSTVLLTDVLDRSDEFFGAQAGILAGIALAFLIATIFGVRRWLPQTVIILTTVGFFTELVAMAADVTTWEAARAVGFGAVAAFAAWFSRRYLRPPMRRFHLWGSIALAFATGLVAVSQAPWDVIETIVEWLSDVPLPILLIVAGSLVLILITWVIRTAVGRIADEDAEGDRTAAGDTRRSD